MDPPSRKSAHENVLRFVLTQRRKIYLLPKLKNQSAGMKSAVCVNYAIT